VDDFRLAAAIRRVRHTYGWRQVDLAARSGVSRSAISRMERGMFGPQSVDALRAVASALEMRLDLVPRWRGGELDRLLNRAHSTLHESVARAFAARWPAWMLVPEATFSVYGERGSIDLLGWHPGRRAVLVIELKTEIVDVNELLATLDRKRRLAPGIGRDHGWAPTSVSPWLIVSDSRTNRRRITAHEAMVASALPNTRGNVLRWLRDPVGPIAARSFWTDSRPEVVRRAPTSIRRVRPPRSSVNEREIA
jgi:transcriptional regulator with XRE-family HTH domain